MNPVPVYLILTGGYWFLFITVINVNIVFMVEEARLNPFELVLIGTILEATVFLCEVPTGVVADVISRRLSILIGLVLVGLGLAFTGVFPRFETIAIAQVIWGLGFTFISGARQAWIADEVGVDRAGQVYLRSAQVEQLVRLVAIPFSTALATVQLNLPILIGGLMFLPLALFLSITMPEHGFRPTTGDARRSFGDFKSTLLAGGRLVRGSPLLITVFCIAGLYGIHSEGFDRLWIKHFYDNLGFPVVGSLEPVVWIGAIRMGAALLGIIVIEVVRRRLNITSHAAVSRGLFLVFGLQAVTVCVLATAGGFVVGMLAFWSTVMIARAYHPLYLAWINQNVDSSVRATVLSMSSQVDAIGQIAGGPPVGLIGSLISLRAAIFVSGLALLPALPLFMRAFGQGRSEQSTAGPAPGSTPV